MKNKELQVFECKSIKKKIMSASNTYHFGVFYFKASAKCYKQFEWKELSKAAIQRCSYEKVFWKYAANLQDNTHAEIWFQ